MPSPLVCSELGIVAAFTPVQAAATHVEMTTTDGVVPGTGISYTIGIARDDGGPRNIFPADTSDNGTWYWQNGFPEFLSFGTAETLTVSFSAPVPISDIVLGLNSTSASSSSFAVAGGTAATSNFESDRQPAEIFYRPDRRGGLRREHRQYHGERPGISGS